MLANGLSYLMFGIANCNSALKKATFAQESSLVAHKGAINLILNTIFSSLLC